jgi:hypothetical protein
MPFVPANHHLARAHATHPSSGSHPMTIPGWYFCATCGEQIDTTVDPSAGRSQSYVEDCQVCCRPNVLKVSLVTEDGELAAIIEAEPES